MVGPTGSGKTAAWQLLLDCMEVLDKKKGEAYIIDPKAVSKDDLYGKLDSTTADWTDGVFTQILRKILANVRGESQKRHWIIFDGDVDPEWAENLNSVLDDNKLLTLPSGERLSIPPNVRIMFEVESLKYATLATVSRCGMVWFSEEVISIDNIYKHFLLRLQQDDYDGKGEIEEAEEEGKEKKTLSPEDLQIKHVRKSAVLGIEKMFVTDGFITQCIEYAKHQTHVMVLTPIRVLEAMFALIRKGITNILEFNENRPEFPLTDD